MFERVPVTGRDWGIFGLRWAVPAVLAARTLLGPGLREASLTAPAMAVILVGVISNLILLALLIAEWRVRGALAALLCLDVVLSAGAIYVAGPDLAWLGVIPVALVGFCFDWLAGLIVGAAYGAAVLGMHTLLTRPADLDLTGLLVFVVMYPAVGALAALLMTDTAPEEEQARQIEDQQAALATRRSLEYMNVAIEMAEVLSASKLDPDRVLRSAIEFGLDGLRRVGVDPPLYGAILLFAEGVDGIDPTLQMATASPSVTRGDRAVRVPGRRGAIARALAGADPVISNGPAADGELREFETFRACQQVLCARLSAGSDQYGVMLIGSEEPQAFEEAHVELIRAVANQAAASLNNARLYNSLKERENRIVEVERAARTQLAAELHDGPTQGLSAITMRLNYVRRLLDKRPDDAVNELYKIEDLARQTTKEVRMMLFELRPKSLEKGLESALQQFATKMQETYDQNVEVIIYNAADRLLDSHTQVTLFSIASEAVHNARKHARADLVRVVLAVQDDTLVLAIEDNGQGFNVEEALAAARQREGHLGLVNLYERAALVDGVLTINSVPGNGTWVFVAIPMEVVNHRRQEEAGRRPAESNGSGPDQAATPSPTIADPDLSAKA